MTTQVQNEGSNLAVYDVGFHLKHDLLLLEAYDMTTEAALAKLMWILGETRARRRSAACSASRSATICSISRMRRRTKNNLENCRKNA